MCQLFTLFFVLLVQTCSGIRFEHEKALEPPQFDEWIKNIYAEAASRRHSSEFN
jgi:hypothetical protein